jgi:glycosyltransferase involved in cell wall biosynthesis
MKVVICEYHPWKSDFRIGNHHYARMFLDRGWDVLWISHPVSFVHGLKPENRERVELASRGPVRHPGGPTELVPYTRLPFLKAPILSSTWVLENSHRFFSPSLVDSLGRAGFDKPDLLWITDATMHAIADAADAKALAVRIADDNLEFAGTPKSLRAVEKRLIRRADAVFATSLPLQKRFEAMGGARVHLLRNGVDFDHFQGEFEKPREYEEIAGPIAIYMGAMDNWFALEWIESLAARRPDITVVLIGRDGIDLAPLNRFPNVRYLGRKPYEEIPRYLAHASVGIIPFRRTRLVESISPLKLFEFLAAGLPVVSARWSELEFLAGPALLASDGEEFVRLVARVVDEDWKGEQGDYFRRFAKENSWQARFDSAMSVLSEYLQ